MFFPLFAAIGLPILLSGTSFSDTCLDSSCFIFEAEAVVDSGPDNGQSSGVSELSDTLQTSTVVASRGIIVTHSDTLRLSGQNSDNIVSSLLLFPSLQLSDYGSFSGYKSVGLRGMGSSHTSVYIDGVRVGNVQAGQCDLGMLPLDQFNSVVVDYAQNSVSFSSSVPYFADGRKVSGVFSAQNGSFGTWKGTAALSIKLGELSSLSFDASGIISRGDFPYGNNMRREGNDIKRVQGGVSARGLFHCGKWNVKAWVNASDRGTPGSIYWLSNDRQQDINSFVQGVVKKEWGRYSLDVSSKLSVDRLAYQTSYGDSQYDQREYQLNSAHLFKFNSKLQGSLRADVQWDRLKSYSVDAGRLSAVASAGLSLKLRGIEADASLFWDGAFDSCGKSHYALEPSLEMKFRLAEGLRVVAFARRAYRIPLFNELYYVGYGNPDLKCEDAMLSDVGLEFVRNLGLWWRLTAKLDGFYYGIDNKIASSPSPEDPNIWRPYNIGKVRSSGFDSNISVSGLIGELGIDGSLSYSLLNALDRTEGSSSYGRMIPYVARHSFVFSAKLDYRAWVLDATGNVRSGRYDASSELPSWSTFDLSLSKDFDFGLGLYVKGLNILDCRYELSSGYPMAGRSYVLGIKYLF